MQINTLTQSSSVARFHTHEHKHTPWLDEVKEEYVPVGQAPVFALVVDKCLFVTCGGQAQKAASVLFNVRPR